MNEGERHVLKCRDEPTVTSSAQRKPFPINTEGASKDVGSSRLLTTNRPYIT